MIRLITEKELKDNAPISQGVDSKQIAPHIDTSQDIYIQEVVGSKLYASLLEKFATDNLSEEETALVDILKKVLIFRTFETAIPFLSIRTGAVGTYQNSDTGYVPAGKNLIEYLVNELREKAEFYSERARSFIKASLSSFPLYTSREQSVKPLDATDTYDCDIFFY